MIGQESTPTVNSDYEQKWLDGLNSGNVSVADEIFQPDCVIHINGNPQRDLTLENFKQMVNGLLAAFPDLHFTINDQFASDQKVSTRWTAKGTNTGSFGEMPATGRTVEIEGLIIDHVVNGKVAKRWELWDQMAMMQQLGFV
ncbi:ester cyclase [Pedobacter sp. P351]|uniref:ester cyclase n=1 Tax=Pedobacter superstes TaxID=3133441 RepID=UPI0030A51077